MVSENVEPRLIYFAPSMCVWGGGGGRIEGDVATFARLCQALLSHISSETLYIFNFYQL